MGILWVGVSWIKRILSALCRAACASSLRLPWSELFPKSLITFNTESESPVISSRTCSIESNWYSMVTI